MSEVIAHVTRGDLVESKHRGSIAVVDLKGNILAYVGDPYEVTYFRSAAKPIQALPVVESGAFDKYGLSLKELAVICASHAGEKEHTDTVESILKKLGFEEAALKCGVGEPIYKPRLQELYSTGEKPTQLHFQCSGKHSGMLAVAKKEGYSLEDYFKAEHPVQQMMLKAVADMAEMKPEDIVLAVDGCGVPVFGMPLNKMALCYAKLSDPSGLGEKRREAATKITTAMTSYPKMVGGTRQFDSILMENTEGRLVCKIGAEGIFCIGVMGNGIGIALKIEDGSYRAYGPCIIHTLKQLNILDEKIEERLKKYYPRPVKNNLRDVVGEIRAVFELKKVYEQK
ncbi:MAG: hypothetical protein PWQ82_1149 [Thermosediminibacterales bacterium]|nr:hypothetical protein [Thermosediminibacterales bacterium]MDK2836140.1 hypothetical protein [Thermosediminibacterales bacterium]